MVVLLLPPTLWPLRVLCLGAVAAASNLQRCCYYFGRCCCCHGCCSCCYFTAFTEADVEAGHQGNAVARSSKMRRDEARRVDASLSVLNEAGTALSLIKRLDPHCCCCCRCRCS
ncbi:hypothetical protein Emed_002862 [Eimeria media]